MITTSTPSALEFVEQRTALLAALSEALSAATSSVVGFDLPGFEARIAEQQKLCTAIAELDRQASMTRRRIELKGDITSPALMDAISRLREAQARVDLLNRQHQALLQRSRRTVRALMRSYQSFAADLYENPAQRHTGESAGEPAGKAIGELV